jgi:formylglycine-generating enzyme required for sulfatase activity
VNAAPAPEASGETVRPEAAAFAANVSPSGPKAAAVGAPSGGTQETPGKEGMIFLPGGTFRMGNGGKDGFPADGEGPVHEVTLKPFYIDACTVTNRQFAEFVNAKHYRTEAEKFGWSYVFEMLLTPRQTPYLIGRAPGTPWWFGVKGAFWFQPEGPGSSIDDRMDHPVVHVTWNDAVAYCKWAGKRLPTEAEWEYAARGGLEQKTYPWGDELTPGGRHMCNIWQGTFPEKNTARDGYIGTAPARSFEPNGFGLYNVAGNVWEWVVQSDVLRGKPEGQSARTGFGRSPLHAGRLVLVPQIVLQPVSGSRPQRQYARQLVGKYRVPLRGGRLNRPGMRGESAFSSNVPAVALRLQDQAVQLADDIPDIPVRLVKLQQTANEGAQPRRQVQFFFPAALRLAGLRFVARIQQKQEEMSHRVKVACEHRFAANFFFLGIAVQPVRVQIGRGMVPDRAGQAEIDQLKPSVVTDHDVRNAHVAMNEPSPVDVSDDVAQLAQYAQRFRRRKRPVVGEQRVFQIAAVLVFHDEEQPAAVGEPVDEPRDGRMGQPFEHRGFPLEHGLSLAPAPLARADLLDDASSPVTAVFAQIADPVAAHAEHAPHLITAAQQPTGTKGPVHQRLPNVRQRVRNELSQLREPSAHPPHALILLPEQSIPSIV